MTTIRLPSSPFSLHPSEATYQAAYRLVCLIDTSLSQHNGLPHLTDEWLGACHWRVRDGRLLRTLDEVVRAILSDDLDLSPVGAN